VPWLVRADSYLRDALRHATLAIPA
jgi:hypothetical protein